MNKQSGIVPLWTLVLIAIAIGSGVYFVTSQNNLNSDIDSFEKCAAAGYPIMESYPRQCAEPGGQSFTEVISTDDNAASCAAVLCMVGSTCVNGACITNETNVPPENDKCMTARCIEGYYCDSTTGKCVQGRADAGDQGIYGTTYFVSGAEQTSGSGKAGYYAEIPVFKTSRKPAPGTRDVVSANADAIIKSDAKGIYRLALPAGNYCAWDYTLRNCFDPYGSIVVKANVWMQADFTIMGQ